MGILGKSRRFKYLLTTFVAHLSFPAFIYAADETTAPPDSNEAASQDWQQQSTGSPAPELVKQEDGSTKIEWHGGAVLDYHDNSVEAVSGRVRTPLSNGQFTNLQVQSDLRGTNAAGDVNYFQLGVTTTNDRSILSQFSRQINQVQIGRAGSGYLIAAGDVAPNFSSLSSALGVRGLIGQKQIGTTTFSGYTGYVVPSWEYLESRVPRTQLSRTAIGGKVEHTFDQKFTVYATAQSLRDHAGTADFSGIDPTYIGTNSLGFQYTEGRYTLAGEAAVGRFSGDKQQNRRGYAEIIDGGWRGDVVSLRAGYHNIEAAFVSLSQAAQPGIREAYVGGDWTAASWLNLGLDLRNSQGFTLAAPPFTSQKTDTDSGSLRANINFGVNHPGWALALLENMSHSRDPNDFSTRNEQSSAALSYANASWNSGIAYALEHVRSQASPLTDSDTGTWQGNIGRRFSNEDSLTPASWTIGTNLSYTLQQQSLLTGLDLRASNIAFSINANRNNWGNINFVISRGTNSRPSGLPSLNVDSVQVDASHQIGTKGSIKLYARQARRNVIEPAIGSIEKLVGLTLGYTF